MGTPDALYQLLALLFAPDADSVYLSPAPLYHAAPLRYCLTMQRFGATVVLMEKFDPEQALAAIEQYRVTHSQWVPTMFIRMLKLPAGVRAKYDLSSLRYAVHAAAPSPIPVKEQMIEWWGPVLHEYYSGTEGICFTYVAHRARASSRPGHRAARDLLLAALEHLAEPPEQDAGPKDLRGCLVAIAEQVIDMFVDAKALVLPRVLIEA